MNTAKEMQALVYKSLDEMWNARNLNVAEEIFAPNVKTYNVADPKPVEGLEGLKTLTKSYLEAFPDLRIEAKESIVTEEKGAVLWRVTGTHKGTFMGVKPTNRKVAIEGVFFFRFLDGKVTEQWAHWDVLGLLKQIGIAPPMPVPV